MTVRMELHFTYWDGNHLTITATLSQLTTFVQNRWRYYIVCVKTGTLSHEAVEESYERGGYVAELRYNQVSAAKVIEPFLTHNRCLIHLPRYSVKSEMYTKSSLLGRLSLQ